MVLIGTEQQLPLTRTACWGGGKLKFPRLVGTKKGDGERGATHRLCSFSGSIVGAPELSGIAAHAGAICPFAVRKGA